MKLCDNLPDCSGSMRHACVALLWAMDPSESPCRVPAWRLWAILRSSPLMVVLSPTTLARARKMLSGGVDMRLRIGVGDVWLSVYIQVEGVSDCREMRTAVVGGLQGVPSYGL